VQGKSVEEAVRYARHAEKLGARALISLPPAKADAAAQVAYYHEIGKATALPLFVQAVGNMSVETVLEMYRRTPTLRYIKDEAGQPLLRMAALREGTGGELKIFTGAHGRTLIDEMIRGLVGEHAGRRLSRTCTPRPGTCGRRASAGKFRPKCSARASF